MTFDSQKQRKMEITKMTQSVMERAIELFHDEDFKAITDQLMFFTECNNHKVLNAIKLLWKSAYEEARFERKPERERKEMQMEKEYMDSLFCQFSNT